MIKIFILCLSFNIGNKPVIIDSTLVEDIYSVIDFFITRTDIDIKDDYIRDRPISFFLFEHKNKSDKIESLKEYFFNINSTLIDTIFTEADLDYMLKQYEQNKKFRWSNILKSKVNYGIVKEKKNKYLLLSNEKNKRAAIFYFSMPLFNKERNKVLIYEGHFFIDSYSTFMYLLYKKGNKWEIKIVFPDLIT